LDVVEAGTVMTIMQPIPRKPYAIAMMIASVVAIGAGVGVGMMAEGSGSSLEMGIAGVMIGLSGLSVVPVLGKPLVSEENWGLAVLGTSVTRTMLAVGGMMVLIEGMGLSRKGSVYGVMVGATVLMVVEAAVAVWLLSRREQGRVASLRSKEEANSVSGASPSGVDGSAS